jgi:hypothetical protein
MADLDKIAKALRLFNEKADKLARLSFLDKMNHPDSGVSISFNRDEGEFVKEERRGPEEEAIDAFVLTFRYFIQDNEATSFANMEKFYLEAPLDADLQQKFVTIRKEVNEYLNKPTNLKLNEESLTNRRLMEIFIFGGFSHANEEKRRIYKTLMGSMGGLFFENEFLRILRNIHIAIAYIKTLNEEALKHLPGPS